MSAELIASLENQVNRLNGESAANRHKAKQYKADADTLRTENVDLKSQLGALVTDRDTWKGKAETGPSEHQRRADEAEAKLRTITHKGAFARIAKARGAREEALDDLFSLSGYNAQGDVPDEAKIAEVVNSLVTSRAYAFTPPPGDPGKPKLPAGPGALRGDPAGASVDGKFVVRRSDTSDYAWMKANRGKLAEAEKAGTLLIVDE